METSGGDIDGVRTRRPQRCDAREMRLDAGYLARVDVVPQRVKDGIRSGLGLDGTLDAELLCDAREKFRLGPDGRRPFARSEALEVDTANNGGELSGESRCPGWPEKVPEGMQHAAKHPFCGIGLAGWNPLGNTRQPSVCMVEVCVEAVDVRFHGAAYFFGVMAILRRADWPLPAFGRVTVSSPFEKVAATFC